MVKRCEVCGLELLKVKGGYVCENPLCPIFEDEKRFLNAKEGIDK